MLEGEYPAEEGPGTDARAAYGYGWVEGCKQFRVGELLTADGGVPLYPLRQEGNQADVGTILTALTAVTAHVSLPDCLVVGDSRLLSTAIIGKLRQQQFSFLAPIARTDAVWEAYAGRDPAAWVQLEHLPRREQPLPEEERTRYQGQETEFLFRDPETQAEVPLRRLFVRNATERVLRGVSRQQAIHRYCAQLTTLLAKIGQRGAITPRQVERRLVQGAGSLNVLGAMKVAEVVDTSKAIGEQWITGTLPTSVTIAERSIPLAGSVLHRDQYYSGANAIQYRQTLCGSTVLWGTWCSGSRTW